MGSIYIYDVGTAPLRAPWTLYEGHDDRQVLRDDLLAIVDEPEFVDTVSNILQDAQGSDEYGLYKDLADRKIDYFLIATGGSMDQLVAVRSEDDFRRFIDHMEDHYAADVYVGEDDDMRLIRASSGKFVYHNPARSNPEEYILIEGSELDDFDEFEDFYEVDPETVDPWRVVRAVNLGVSSRKEFCAGHLFNGQLVSALFVAPVYADCFSFDVAVLPEHQSRGLGTDLVDTAIEVFEMYECSKDGDFEYCVHVVNPHMKSLLERKGFYVVESTSAGDEWIMERSRT